MNSNPDSCTISIVIPVYNGARSIGQLVDELVEKIAPLFKIEIILVNDCSKDNSEEVCMETAKKHNHIVSYFSLAINVGEDRVGWLYRECGHYWFSCF